MKSVFALFISILFVTPTYAGLFGPSNYDDCVLENIKTAKTESAVAAVYHACRSKFPEKKPTKKNVECGRNSVDPDERSQINFPMPLQTLKTVHRTEIKRINRIVDSLGITNFEIYVQSDLFAPIQEVRISGFQSKTKEAPTGNYVCNGRATPNTTGRFVCSDVDPKAKFFSVVDVTTTEINVLWALKQLGHCS